MTAADDNEDDSHTFALVSSQSWLAVSSSGTMTLTLTALTNSDIGDHTVQVSITDNNSVNDIDGTNTVTLSYTITLLGVNTAPTVNTNSCEDQEYLIPLSANCAISATDIDTNDVLVYTETSTHSWFTISSSNGNSAIDLTGMDDEDVGVITVVVGVTDDNTVNDSDGPKTTTESFTLTLYATNDAPVIASNTCEGEDF